MKETLAAAVLLLSGTALAQDENEAAYKATGEYWSRLYDYSEQLAACQQYFSYVEDNTREKIAFRHLAAYHGANTAVLLTRSTKEVWRGTIALSPTDEDMERWYGLMETTCDRVMTEVAEAQRIETARQSEAADASD